MLYFSLCLVNEILLGKTKGETVHVVASLTQMLQPSF